MRLAWAVSRSSRRTIAAIPLRRAGLARNDTIAQRARTPEPPEPLTLDHRLGAAIALRILATHGQAMAFVATERGPTSIVSAEDLRFAADWAGPRATVAHAVTQALVDVAPDQALPFPTHIEEP